MKAAVYSYVDDPRELRRLEQRAVTLGYAVKVRIGGPAGRSAVVRGAKRRDYGVVLTRDLAELGDIQAELIRNVRELAAHGCDVVVMEGASFEGVPKPVLLRVLDALIDYRHSLYDARSRRMKAGGSRAGARMKTEVDEIKNGERIAALLKEENRRSIRAIADHVGVAPGTVMRVKRILAAESEPA